VILLRSSPTCQGQAIKTRGNVLFTNINQSSALNPIFYLPMSRALKPAKSVERAKGFRVAARVFDPRGDYTLFFAGLGSWNFTGAQWFESSAKSPK
jgi:hypothetical protein